MEKQLYHDESLVSDDSMLVQELLCQYTIQHEKSIRHSIQNKERSLIEFFKNKILTIFLNLEHC